MTRKSARLLASILLLVPLTAWLARSDAQQRELDLERILNPMPGYDPFEKAASAPQFFPDEVDKRSRELLIDALLNRDDALNNHLKFFKTEDAQLQKQHGAETG